MTPRAESPGAGLGLGLIAELANAIEINDGPDGTSVTMRFDREA
jgi:hypothetical protein